MQRQLTSLKQTIETSSISISFDAATRRISVGENSNTYAKRRAGKKAARKKGEKT